ncbi:hypothetical protein P3T76_003933 [Phytophthora citrophthora]|uniref:RxLR effector protein n=1 Tax=Phytophthora citrophthora TaxID=4793 RepID=A0AAD9GT95_9STRA|nr:hypothetical protein P3T76_003933 [Phytophthora citrophthora]
MVRLLSLAAIAIVAVVSFSPAQATIPDPIAVANKATVVAMDTSPAAPDLVTDAAKRNTNDESEIQKKI